MDSAVYIMVGMASSFVLCLALLLFYLRYRKHLMHEQLRRQLAETRHQKVLIHAVIKSQEQERKRIGMDLHDEIGASLSAVKLMIQQEQQGPDSGEPVGTGVDVCAEIDKIMHTVRHISHNLYPLLKGKFGFSDALSELCDKMNGTGGPEVMLSFASEEAEVFLQGDPALNMYRVVSELINNSVRHSGATLIKIAFCFRGAHYVMDYKDDGVGIDRDKLQASKGMGFKNIESRLGMLEAKLEWMFAEKGCFMRILIPA